MTDLATPVTGWDRRRERQLHQYELIALRLFADRGYHSVTVDDIATEAEVSARTLFRYFPSKEDFLLGYPQRNVAPLLSLIAALPTASDPFPTAWRLVRDEFLREPRNLSTMDLWRRAAADAPEVHARVRGTHQQLLLEALTAYCTRCLGATGPEVLRARLTAGVIVGMELAMIETLGRSTLSAPEIVTITEATLLATSGEALLNVAGD